MSVRLTNAVYQRIFVSGNEALLLLAVADLADDHGENVYPSAEYLAWKSNVSLRTVRSILKAWRARSVLTVVGALNLKTRERRPACANAGGRGMVPIYRLDLSNFPTKPAWRDGENSATVAPFDEQKRVQPQAQRVQPQAEKGATTDTKGCETVQRNKEEPLVEPLEEPSAEPSARADAPSGEIRVWNSPEESAEHYKAKIRQSCRDKWRISCPWSGRDTSELKKLLASISDWTDAQFDRCLANLLDSYQLVPAGSPPYEWLRYLPKAYERPLDLYGKPAFSKAELKQRERDEHWERMRASILEHRHDEQQNGSHQQALRLRIV